MSAKQQIWTAAEIDRMLAHREAGLGVQEIADLLNRTYQSVEGKMHRLREECTILPHDIARFVIPDHVLADRDRRLAMQPASLTAALCGDPLEPRHGR